MSEYVDFHYMPLEGKIAGEQVLKQTEDAINDLGNKVYSLDIDQSEIDEAVEKSNEAINTANSALSAVTTGRSVWFNNVAEMVATDIEAGVTAETKGYYVANDGGNALYLIRQEKSGDVVDGGSLIALDNGNMAELVTDGTVNVKQFGAIGNGTDDDTTVFQNTSSYAQAKGFVPFVGVATYKITSNITGTFNSFGEVTITGGGSVDIINLQEVVSDVSDIRDEVVDKTASAKAYSESAATSATNAASSASSASTTATQLMEYLGTKETLTAPAVDPTLSIEGAAADAKVTGLQITTLAEEKMHFYNLERGAIKDDGTVGTEQYVVHTTSDIVLPYPITLHINNGYYYRLLIKNGSTYTGYSSSRTYDMRVDANTPFRVNIVKSESFTSADIYEFAKQLSFSSYGAYNTEQNTIRTTMQQDGGEPINTFFDFGNLTLSTGAFSHVRYRIATPNAFSFNKDVNLRIKDDYEIGITMYDADDNVDKYVTWITKGIYIPKDKNIKIVVRKIAEDTSVEADFDAFYKAVYVDAFRFEDVEQEVNALPFVNIKWELGTLNSGNESNSTNRIRSGYILVGRGSVVSLDVRYAYSFLVAKYDLNKNFIVSENFTYKNSVYIDEDCYIRILVSKNPVTDFTQDEVATYASYVKVYRILPSSMVNDVPLTRDEFEQNAFYPAYYDTQMKANITKLTELIADAGFSGDNFVFIIDVHWKANRKHSPMLIRRIVNDLNIDKVLCGGDVIGGGGTLAENMDESRRVISAFKNGAVPFYVAYGNHDGPTYTGTQMTYEQFYALDQKQTDNKMVYNKTDYCFYFDNPACQTRYIFLNTAGNGQMNQSQFDWIADTLANVPANYKVIFVAHVVVVPISTPTPLGRDESYYMFTTAMHDTVLPMLDTFNATHTTEKVVAMFTGHTHINGIFCSPSGIPIIMTDCDVNNTGSTEDGVNPDYAIGTITEQCFDTVVTDYGHNVINCVRTGRGRSRKINTQLVDVSTTTTLTTDLEDVTWVSKDETVATVGSNGVVTAVASGVARITATNDTDMEVWMVRVL